MDEVVIHGDCLEELKKIPDNSIDSVVTDPPYGLSQEPDIYEVLTKWMNGEDYHHRGGGFMGKTWDSFVPGPSIWKEVYRVLKPGGHVLCFAGTRTQDLMTISLRLAGFEVRDVIEWLYFSGFPKSMDVGKAFDKKNGSVVSFVDQAERFGAYLKERRLAKGLTAKQIDDMLGLNTAYSWWEGRKSGLQPPSKENYLRLKPILELDDRFDEFIERVEAEREKIGERNDGVGSDSGSGCYNWNNGKSTQSKIVEITAPATELAKKWDGWGTSLKPSHEPIILCRKPIEKNVAYNVEKWGCGAINVRACKIGNDLVESGRGGRKQKSIFQQSELSDVKSFSEGRFPANCVTTEPDAFFSKYFNVTPPELCKKASKKDRNSDWLGNEISLPLKEKVFGNDKGDGFGRGLSDSKHPTRNNHPCVKPLNLMSWLVRLITPPGGIVLDPFCGSGSTLVAAKREGFGFIGIEKEPEYVEIARARACGSTIAG